MKTKLQVGLAMLVVLLILQGASPSNAQSHPPSYLPNDGKPATSAAAAHSSTVAIQRVQPGATKPGSTVTQPAAVPQQARPPLADPPEEVMVDFRSTPKGADISVDGSYVGRTPTSISLSPGEYDIKISKHDFRSYEHNLTVTTEHLTVSAYLQRLTVRFDQ